MRAYILLIVGVVFLAFTIMAWLGDFTRKDALETKAKDYTWMFRDK